MTTKNNSWSDPAEFDKLLDDNIDLCEDYFLRKASSRLIELWMSRRSHKLSAPEISTVKKISTSSSNSVLRPLRRTSLGSSATKLKQLFGEKNEGDDVTSNSTAPEDDETIITPKKSSPVSPKDLKKLDEGDLLMALIRDISNELDINALSHKILVNVSILTNGDRCSLFLVHGSKDRRYLVSRLFDVTQDSTVSDSIRPEGSEIILPVGVGIAGHTAATGEMINIHDAYEDPRFNSEIDKHTGYTTHSILCLPIKSYDGEVIGVAQVINKKAGNHAFNKKDEDIFAKYLTFCGIGLTNAKLFEISVSEYKRNQVMLNLARNIFEETACLDTVVRRIITQAQELLKCERCSVYIVDQSSEEQEIEFSRVFDLQMTADGRIKEPSEGSKDMYTGIATYVATSGEAMNITDLSKDANTDTNKAAVDCQAGTKAKCMLCVPIKNNVHKVIGVAQLINKHNGHPFAENEESMFESFGSNLSAIWAVMSMAAANYVLFIEKAMVLEPNSDSAFSMFCGLGIHNTQAYEDACRLLAKQTLAMEVLSYHASANEDEANALSKSAIPDCDKWELQTFEFDDIILTEEETCLASMRMFIDLDLLNTFHIPSKVMCRWLLSVKKNYRPVTYHNWRHAFNVAQTMFAIFEAGRMKSWFSDLELLVMMVGCLCHDLDHRGTNNTFQVKSDSPISKLYSTSTMEHHHFDHSIMILNSEGNNILAGLSSDQYREGIEVLEHAILSTDLALYFQKRGAFQKVADSENPDWTTDENKSLLRAMLMTACDVSAIAKPWKVQQRVAEMVASEFFEQGDMERDHLNAEPIPMMDRDKKGDLPKMQVGFIDFVCMPVYKLFYQINENMKGLYDGVSNNRRKWQELADNPDLKEPTSYGDLSNDPNLNKNGKKPTSSRDKKLLNSNNDSAASQNGLVKRKSKFCTVM